MELIQSADYQILLFLIEHVRSAFLTPIFLFITHLGDGGVTWLLVAALCLLRRETRPCGVIILLALVLGLLVGNLAIKNLVARPRPFQTYS
ncbi:MAG: phosphatase PAP2 family protein, partial [Butyricicoccus sp.]|nr:phosphatase PAP2 family protein [Butyricicoccus sp.]